MKKLFNLGVFKEAFSQLKIVGFISVAMYMVAGILTPLGYIIELIDDSYTGNSKTLEFGVEYFFILFGLMYVLLPVMMIVVFFWMTRRHSCDFYHALPIKRETIYFSSIVAVTAWVGVIFVAATIIPLIVVGMIPRLEIDMVNFWKIMGYVFAGCIQMIGVFSLGIMLTGHGLTNIVASLMILLVPRAIMLAILAMIDEFMPFIEINFESWYLNPFYNIGFGSFYYLFTWLDSGSFGIAVPMIYSISLGLIYMTIAGFLFKVRKSEAASQASTYGFVQSIFRMIPSYVFSLIGVYFVLETFYEYDFDISYYFFATVFFTIALLAYFIYELITTRRWKSVGKSAKQLPILAGAIVLTGIIIVVSTNAATARKIEADKIKFIEVEFNEQLGDFATADKVIIKNEELNKIIEEAYADQVEDYYNHDSYYEDRSIFVGVNQGGATFYRRVCVTDDQYEIYQNAYENALKNSDIRIELPKASNVTEMYLTNHGGKITDKQIETLYTTLREEVKNVNYGDLISIDESDVYDKINIYGYYPDYFYCQIPITDLTPQTKELLITMYKQHTNSNNSNNNEFANIVDKLNKLDTEYTLELDLSIIIIAGDDTIVHSLHTAYVSGYDKAEAINLLNMTIDSSGDNTVNIEGHIYMYDEYDNYNSYPVNATYLIDDIVVEEYDEFCTKYIY